MTTLAAGASANHTQLVIAAILGIGVVIVLITWLKVHPFLSLIIGSAVLGLAAGYGASKTVDSFVKGVGDTVGSVGLLIALGAMIGGLLADSGGAQLIVNKVVERVSPRMLPWAMVAVAALVGLPLFFEIGVVLLVPIVLLVARRSGVSLLKVGIPTLAGLSVLHGLVPPHPGPLVAISLLKADLGLTLLYGLIIAIPTVIIAGPVFGTVIARYVHVPTPVALAPTRERVGTGGGGAMEGDAAAGETATRGPRLIPTVLTMLLPVVLMLARAVGELTLSKGNSTRSVLDVIGNPVVALLIGVVVAMFTLGVQAGFPRDKISASVGGALGPIAGILLIVAAGGGFKQTLVDAGVGNVVASAVNNSHLSVLVLGWLIAVGIRLATGSATVATITAAGIVVPLAGGLGSHQLALLALAIGAGSLFFSHVNDAGFWLVKEYFGMSVGQTLASWSVMETIISVVGLIGALLLNLIV
ncbi:MAG: GntP family permease [Actinomycetota bacterium]|nr:GntP family permease [Actinomycetota bacterium]